MAFLGHPYLSGSGPPLVGPRRNLGFKRVVTGDGSAQQSIVGSVLLFQNNLNLTLKYVSLTRALVLTYFYTGLAWTSKPYLQNYRNINGRYCPSGIALR